jgi:hypothetical protein
MCQRAAAEEAEAKTIEVEEEEEEASDSDEEADYEFTRYELCFIDVIQSAKGYSEADARHFLYLIRTACLAVANETKDRYDACKRNPSAGHFDPEADITSAWTRTYLHKRLPDNAAERFEFFNTLYVLYNTLRVLHDHCTMHYGGVRSPSRAANNDQDITIQYLMDHIYNRYHMMFFAVQESEHIDDSDESDDSSDDSDDDVI